MKQLLTPKQIARAIDVSESSVKRWCDKGAIAAQYTDGGHRRIAISSLIEFLRLRKFELVHPEALGLPPTTGQTSRVLDRALSQMTEALLTGNEPRCRQIAIDLYLAEHSLSVICDDIFAAAFREIGDRWACGDAEVFQERHGCQITLNVLTEIKMMLPTVNDNLPIAIGCAAEHDQYSLGTTMAELVLQDAKWNAISLGDNLPFETIAAAIRQYRPRLFWLSCSHIENETKFLAEYAELYDEFGQDVAFALGGYALTETVRKQMKYASYCDNMQHLEEFAQTLSAAIESKSSNEN